MAWFSQWSTTDLVWSLWLSSLVVGYAMIVWNLSSTLRGFGRNVVTDPQRGMGWVGGAAILGIGFLFGLAFFTVHFGGFHFVHSAFLASFFPLSPGGSETQGFPDAGHYMEVVRQYWIFLPIAFLAERQAFARGSVERNDISVTSQAVRRRKPIRDGSGMMAPYKNVIRMHLLIFFFAAVHFAKIDNFAVYAVVYAVYFFPWRLLRGTKSAAA